MALSHYTTAHMVPQTHTVSHTYNVAHTYQVPHTSYTTHYKIKKLSGYGGDTTSTDEDTTGIVGRPVTPVSVAGSARRVSRRTARRNGRRLRTADIVGDSKSHTAPAVTTSHYGEHIVSTFTKKIPYTVQVPKTYTVQVPHVQTYYKNATHYNYVQKPYTVVTHLVCTPSVHIEYRCPACHPDDSNYAAPDSFGDWLNPMQSGSAIHVFHHVYHATGISSVGAAYGAWQYGIGQTYVPGTTGFAPVVSSYNTDGSMTHATANKSHKSLVVGTSVGIAIAAVAFLAFYIVKRRNSTTKQEEQQYPASIL